MSDTPPSVRSAPPALGQHTCEILREYGYDDPSIQRLIDADVVRTHESLTARAANATKE